MSAEAARWEQRCERLRELLVAGELGEEERGAVATLLDEVGSVLRVCARGEGPPGVDELLESVADAHAAVLELTERAR